VIKILVKLFACKKVYQKNIPSSEIRKYIQHAPIITKKNLWEEGIEKIRR
jgi:hypothetical protein